MRKLLTILFLAAISLTTTAQIQINSDFNVAAQRSVDGKQYKVVNNKHVPYADTADFLATVPKTRRHIGEIAFVYGSAGKINVWQFVGGIDQPNLQLLTGSFSTNRPYPVQSIAEMLALDSAKMGDVAIVADSSKSYILQNVPASSLSNWLEILSPLLANTDYLLEGTTNQYYTDQRSRNAINAGAGIGYNKTTGVITNQYNAIEGNNISITGTMPNKTFGVTGIYTQEQQDSIANKLRSEIQIAAAGGITINQLDSTNTILRDEMKIQAANTGLTSTGGITLVDSTVTILDTIRWTIGATDYVKVTPSSFIINTEDSGLYRRDLIYADTTGNLYKVVGVPDSTIGISPHLPDYAVTVTIVDVFGDQVFNPSPIIIDKGKNPTLQQVTNRGNTTTDRIVSNYNGGGYGFTQNSGINGFSGIGAFNTNSGTGAASGFIAVNNVGHIGQLFQGSSNNAYAPDAFLVRGSGAGGMKITTDIGRISFNRGLLYTVNTPYEMGAFETDGSFRLNNYKNNASKDSVLSTDETGKVIMRFNSGIDNGAFHTMSTASDSSYGTWNRPNGTKDTLVVVADGLVSSGSFTQVNSDWNSVSGVSQILNKPTLFSGSYLDLTNKPTIPTTTSQLTNNSGFITSVPAQTWTSITGKPTFATVATSGSYTDLINKPTIPAQFSPIAGTNMTITGTYPNLTFNSTASGSGGTYTASNGLTMSGSDVQLGGTLSKTTTINTSNNDLLISNASGNAALKVSNTDPTSDGNQKSISSTSINGTAVYGSSTNKTGGYFSSSIGQGLVGNSDNGIAITATAGNNTALIAQSIFNTAPSTARMPLVIYGGYSGGAAAAGLGAIAGFRASTTNFVTVEDLGNIGFVWTNATSATRTSEFSITGVDNAVTKTLLQLTGAGLMKLTQGAPEYTDNAAAVSAGLGVGIIYRTGDNLKIVH